MDKSQELREVLLRYLDADLERIIFSNPRTRESYLKLTVRPLRRSRRFTGLSIF